MSTKPSTEAGGSTYVLGHQDVEVQRLLLQGRLYDDYTEHALRLAGLRPGMRVLDVGCGPGDVSFVAARLVGPPIAEKQGFGIDELTDVDSFASLFGQEALAADAVIMMPPLITASVQVQK